MTALRSWNGEVRLKILAPWTTVISLGTTMLLTRAPKELQDNLASVSASCAQSDTSPELVCGSVQALSYPLSRTSSLAPQTGLCCSQGIWPRQTFPLTALNLSKRSPASPGNCLALSQCSTSSLRISASVNFAPSSHLLYRNIAALFRWHSIGQSGENLLPEYHALILPEASMVSQVSFH